MKIIYIMNNINYYLNAENISSKYTLIYKPKTSRKGNTYYDVSHNGEEIGIVEYHVVDNNYIEIDRIYLDNSKQRKGYGQKIIMDILNYTNADGFELYPLDMNPWIKMGMVFKDSDTLTITKKDFIKKNSKKL